MAEALTPNPRPRFAIASRIQSPRGPLFIGSNNDALERAQARAARASAIRRNPILSPVPPPPSDPKPCLDKDQILELLRNCIKLVSENKINQKNTWELGLIDHLYQIVKAEAETDAETNFQKASCTLEAGVKIYSLRVDSVHSEAYKVLGGINRAGQENEEDTVEDPNIGSRQGKDCSKRRDRNISPLSTLESSFEALNAKKLDVAFAVDPLYHQTSAQFDEGGAKGLLLNNLGVYDGCRVLFDSMEVPGKCRSYATQYDKPDTIDLSFAREHAEQMARNMQLKNEISPTLSYIVSHFDEDNSRPLDIFSSRQKSEDQVDASHSNDVEFDGEAFDNSETWANNNDDKRSVTDEDFNGAVPVFPSYEEENKLFSLQDSDLDDGFKKVDEYFISSLGFASKRNAWAGPDHWKFQKVKGPEQITTTKPRNRKKPDIDIDFIEALDKEMSDIFAPPKNPKSLLLPPNRAHCDSTLPEDCHYQPENLVKLFLLPNIMCLVRRGRKSTGEFRQQSDDYGPVPSWDDGVFEGRSDDGDAHSVVDDSTTLVSQPRQVNKIEVQYDKTSKRVDVQALKETLWDHLQESLQKGHQEQEETLSFRDMLANIPSECRAAPIEDISPHLCFICLLHLANEHGLSISGCESLDDLSIRLPEKQDM